MSKLKRLVDLALSDTEPNNEGVNLSTIPNFQAQKIAADTGIQIRGGFKTVSLYAVIHTFKRHGNDKEEKERGQRGVTAQDFDLLPEILLNPDTVTKGKDGNRGKQALIFVKRLEKGFYHVVMSVFKKDGNVILDLDTMYIKK
jgi:hypothetical protein